MRGIGIMILKNYLRDPLKYAILSLSLRGYLRWLPDKTYLKWNYWANLRKRLNLKNPKTFNEKLQWLKLYDRKPIYTTMVDKYAAKDYVAERIGEEYIIPTLGVWDSFDDIDFDSLPDQFVLKCTHDSGTFIICRDKTTFDQESAKERLARALKRDYYSQSREWPYKNVKPRIIAEKYMEDTVTGELRDYKFFCFNGIPKILFVATERQSVDSETKFDFFDMDFNHLDVRNGHPNAKTPPSKPACFEEMKRLAKILSADIPHLRVDFYEINGRVYFGELTFYHWSGLVPFDPPHWDVTFGEWIELPAISETGDVK